MTLDQSDSWTVCIGSPPPGWLCEAIEIGVAIPVPQQVFSVKPWGQDGVVIRYNGSAVLAKPGDTLTFARGVITVEHA